MDIKGFKLLPSHIGKLTEKIFDEYSIYIFNIPSNIIDNYLPNKLHAFVSKTWKNLAKHYFFYSKPIIFASRSQIRNNVESLSNLISLEDFLEDFLSKKDSRLRYNFVITGNSLVFARIPRIRHISYHLLCKHITLSNRSTNVRFAGEFWIDQDDYFKLNNNSGTYQPSDKLIEQAVKLFNNLSPQCLFQGINFRISTQSSTKRRLVIKPKRKLQIKT
ncbi:unnamed protein product [Rotaria sp. Silwood1]|nr:unnamed protein product [Rotaria sp. Silwood1]CAF3659068.1 unnamed protein product [Rotaria sp. Silwood1]CAF4756976.1 unnamed protein product [Rotaria sp. Silwood1]CAF4985905.1 unnamed protein product [Rotaria sp. Silwood1]